MDLGNIVSNSFKYPFGDLKRLGFVFLLFVLTLILPIGLIVENDITLAIGIIALFVFILIAPGYMVLVIKSGIDNSSQIPYISPVKSIVNTFKLLIVHLCYITIPTVIVFLILFYLTGLGGSVFKLVESPLTFEINRFFEAILITLIGTAIVSWIFSLISFIAQARLANYNSLVEALKVHNVLRDIREIGILKFLGWYVVILILIGLIRAIAIFVMLVPYAGFVLYAVIIIPILALIFFYSLGLLYSNSDNERINDDLDLEKFEKEIQYLKYGRIY